MGVKRGALQLEKNDLRKRILFEEQRHVNRIFHKSDTHK